MAGETPVVSKTWVLKLAVNTVATDGVATVCDGAPLSLHEANTYRVPEPWGEAGASV